MPIENASALFNRLLVARKKSEIDVILRELGDQPTTGLREVFGPLRCSWEPYGGSESNESTIGLARFAGRSLTERVTNGIDALLELARTRATGDLPASPAQAACEWFGRAISGPRTGLYTSEDKEGDLSRGVSVLLSDSGLSEAPTIDVLDAGIGIVPEDLGQTILSLQEGNKIKKRYLMGAFGQGGSSTLAFCEYVVVVSRSAQAPDRVGFTIVRLVNPGEDYELEVYSYLTFNGAMPFTEFAGPIQPYATDALTLAPILSHGTLVRHVGFKLPNLSSGLSSSPGNLYHYFHLSLFDPLLPFRVADIRGNTARDERVGGSRNRLMKLVAKAEDDTEESGRRRVIHHREMEDIIPLGDDGSRIGVEYWVIEALRTTKGQLTLRSSSSELFVQRGYPIIATLNGQNQGELPAKFLKDLGLGMLSRHIVVHLDATRTDRLVRRQLLTTTREGFKEGPQLENLMKSLAAMLRNDSRLFEIERELTDKLVNRDNRATSDRVKKQITKLLRDAGFARTASGDSDDTGGEKDTGDGKDDGSGAGGGTGGGGGGEGGGGGGSTEQLQTLPFPDVTRLEIVSPATLARVRLNGRAIIRIETDADDRFDEEQLISIDFLPQQVELAAVSTLRAGRKRWQLRAAEHARVGDTGTATVILRTPNGGELRAAIGYEITPPVDGGGRGKRGNVPDFEVLPISPDNEDDATTWAQLWPLYESVSRTKKAEVAYKVFQSNEKTIVFYSTAYGPYVERVERMKSKSKALAELFDENYQVWIGYHAILQLPDDKQADDDHAESLEQERCRVAQVQLRVAAELAELQRKVARSDDTDD